MAEKTEQPTEKKRRDARNEGQVAHSQDVGQLVGFTAALLFFWIAGDTLLASLARMLLLAGRLPTDAPFDRQAWLLAGQLGSAAAGAALPLLCTMLVGGVFGDLIQNGPLFTPKRIKPSFSKFNVWSNIKSRFAVPALVDLLKMVAKAVLLLAASGVAVSASFPDIMRLGGAPLLVSWHLLGEVLRWMGMIALAILVPVAMLDTFWQRSQLTKKLKMSIDEVRREEKEVEGAPEIKGERRRQHEELSNEEIRSRVKRSSVVIVNPIHYAVGLRYEAGATPLPVITFKDFGNRVLKIRRMARQNGVPVVRYPSLARTLHATGRVGRYIPAETLEAVAQILSTVLRASAEGVDATNDRPQS